MAVPHTIAWSFTMTLVPHTIAVPQTIALSHTEPGTGATEVVFVFGSYAALGDNAGPFARSSLFSAAMMSRYPAPTVKRSYVVWYVVLVAGSVTVLVAGKFFVAVFISRAFTWSGVSAGV